MKTLLIKSFEKLKTPSTPTCAQLEKNAGLFSFGHCSKVTALKKVNCVTLRSKQDRAIYYLLQDEKPILIKITVGEAMRLQKKIRNYYPALRKMVISEYMGWTCRDYRCDKKCEAIARFKCEQYLNLNDKE